MDTIARGFEQVADWLLDGRPSRIALACSAVCLAGVAFAIALVWLIHFTLS